MRPIRCKIQFVYHRFVYIDYRTVVQNKQAVVVFEQLLYGSNFALTPNVVLV